VANGYLINVVFNWTREPPQHYELVDRLCPGFGYWIYANVELQLWWQKPVASSATQVSNKRVEVSPVMEWRCQINVAGPAPLNDVTVFGESSLATDGYDPTIDVPNPPNPPPPFLDGYFYDATHPSPWNRMMEDYRYYPDTYKEWTLYIHYENSVPVGITLSWNIASLLSSEYTSFLLEDIDTGHTIDMLSVNTCELSLNPASTLHLRIVASIACACDGFGCPGTDCACAGTGCPFNAGAGCGGADCGGDCLNQCSLFGTSCGGSESRGCECAGVDCGCGSQLHCLDAPLPFTPCGGSEHRPCECKGVDCSCPSQLHCLVASVPFEPCTGSELGGCGCGGVDCECPDALHCLAAPLPFEPCGGSELKSCECDGVDCGCTDALHCKAAPLPFQPCDGTEADFCECGGSGCQCTPVPIDRCKLASHPYQPCGGTVEQPCECQGADCSCETVTRCLAAHHPYQPCDGTEIRNCACNGADCGCAPGVYCKLSAAAHVPCGGSEPQLCACDGIDCTCTPVPVDRCRAAPKPYQPCDGTKEVSCSCGGEDCTCLTATFCKAWSGPYEPCEGTEVRSCQCDGLDCICADGVYCKLSTVTHMPCGGSEERSCECNGVDCACSPQPHCSDAPTPFQPCGGSESRDCECNGIDCGCGSQPHCLDASLPFQSCGGVDPSLPCQCGGVDCGCPPVDHCKAAPLPFEPCGGSGPCESYGCQANDPDGSCTCTEPVCQTNPGTPPCGGESTSCQGNCEAGAACSCTGLSYCNSNPCTDCSTYVIVQITVDKPYPEVYRLGEFMNIRISFENPGDVPHDCIFVWCAVVFPEEIWVPIGDPIPLTIPPGAATATIPLRCLWGYKFDCAWVVAILDPTTYKVMSWDYAVWTYSPSGYMSTTGLDKTSPNLSSFKIQHVSGVRRLHMVTRAHMVLWMFRRRSLFKPLRQKIQRTCKGRKAELCEAQSRARAIAKKIRSRVFSTPIMRLDHRSGNFRLQQIRSPRS